MSTTSSSGITADSFSFRRTPHAPVRRMPRTASSQTRRTTTTTRRQNENVSRANSGPDVTDSTQPSSILNGIVVFIDKSLWEEQRIARLATNMGAKVVEDMNKSVTHIVHGPSGAPLAQPSSKQRLPRLVYQALERNIWVVSPAWVEKCFERQKKLPELYFPYDTDSKDGVCRLRVDDFEGGRRVVDDNPFNLAAEEIESSTDDEGDVAQEFDAPSTIDNPHEPEETPATTLSEPENTEDVITSVRKETSNNDARRLRREKRTAEIAKILQAVKETRKKELDKQSKGQGEENEAPLFVEPKLGDIVLPEEEHLEIWYGNQSFHYDSQQKTRPTTVTDVNEASPRRSSRVAVTNATKRLKRK